MQADYLHSRLVLLKERIDDCEDLVNITLDHRHAQACSFDTLDSLEHQAPCDKDPGGAGETTWLASTSS